MRRGTCHGHVGILFSGAIAYWIWTFGADFVVLGVSGWVALGGELWLLAPGKLH
jgi:hypothetical protein